MKIAIASTGKTIDSEINPVAGRTPYFLIFENKELIEVIKNPFAVGGGGAGFSVAKMLSDKNVNVVIAGHFGANMLSALKEKNIKHKEFSDKSIKEFLE